MTNIDKQHEIVKASLFHFVNSHITAADLSVVDEIVLNYVISILEEASEDPNFDAEGGILYLFNISNESFIDFVSVFISGFVEMMSAYFPDFSQIDTAKVCEWLFELGNHMSDDKKTENTPLLSEKK